MFDLFIISLQYTCTAGHSLRPRVVDVSHTEVMSTSVHQFRALQMHATQYLFKLS